MNCKFCKNLLINTHDIINEYHKNCFIEVNKYNESISRKTSSWEKIWFYRNSGLFYFVDKEKFKDEYINIPWYVLDGFGIVSFDENRYFTQNWVLVFNFERDIKLISLPEFVLEIDSIRSIYLTVDIDNTSDFINDIPNVLLNKCQINYRITSILNQETLEKFVKLKPTRIILDLSYYNHLQRRNQIDKIYSFHDELLSRLIFLEHLTFGDRLLAHLVENLLKNNIHLNKITARNLSFEGVNSYIFDNLRHLELSFIRDAENLNSFLEKTTNLEILSINTTDLYFFPKAIRRLKKLKVLVLTSLGIPEIPSWIIELDQLEYLSLYDNSIVRYPPFLKDFKNLICLDLRENPTVWESEEDRKYLSTADYTILFGEGPF